MSLHATSRSIRGTLRQDVVAGDGHHLVTDEPRRVGGENTAPSPHELLPAAIAACVSTTLVVYARAKDWELGEISVDADYDPKSVPRRMTVVVHLDGDLTDLQLARLERVAASCPVRRSLETAIEIEERIVATHAVR